MYNSYWKIQMLQLGQVVLNLVRELYKHFKMVMTKLQLGQVVLNLVRAAKNAALLAFSI
jgi:hypothetical protein